VITNGGLSIDAKWHNRLQAFAEHSDWNDAAKS